MTVILISYQKCSSVILFEVLLKLFFIRQDKAISVILFLEVYFIYLYAPWRYRVFRKQKRKRHSNVTVNIPSYTSQTERGGESWNEYIFQEPVLRRKRQNNKKLKWGIGRS
jgi:hypothetical protein